MPVWGFRATWRFAGETVKMIFKLAEINKNSKNLRTSFPRSGVGMQWRTLQLPAKQIVKR
jgi:hypothetical protein